MRQITVIVYLNPLHEINKAEKKQRGELRLYLEKEIVDVIPHMGRVIIFQSEKVEHEVRPTKGYQRFAVTSWYRHTHRVEERKV